MIIEIIETIKNKRISGETPKTLKLSVSADKILVREIKLYNNIFIESPETTIGGNVVGLSVIYDENLDSCNGWMVV